VAVSESGKSSDENVGSDRRRAEDLLYRMFLSPEAMERDRKREENEIREFQKWLGSYHEMVQKLDEELVLASEWTENLRVELRANSFLIGMIKDTLRGIFESTCSDRDEDFEHSDWSEYVWPAFVGETSAEWGLLQIQDIERLEEVYRAWLDSYLTQFYADWIVRDRIKQSFCSSCLEKGIDITNPYWEHDGFSWSEIWWYFKFDTRGYWPDVAVKHLDEIESMFWKWLRPYLLKRLSSYNQ